MAIQDKRRNLRGEAMMLDLLHIVLGILAVVCEVLAFLDPERYQILFPVIFWMAGLLNGVSGWYRLKNSGRDKKRRISGIFLCVLAGLLVLIGIVSAITIRR